MRLIDANALIDYLANKQPDCDSCTDIDCLNCVIEYAIKSAPTINPDDLKPRGRWSETNWAQYDEHGEVITHHEITALKCSNCCHCFKKKALWRRNYCPNCGAKMDGKED